MLFGSFADKTAVNLCRNTHHEPARIGAASRSTDAASWTSPRAEPWLCVSRWICATLTEMMRAEHPCEHKFDIGE